MPVLFRLVLSAAALIIIIGSGGCAATKRSHGCGCGLEEHISR